MFDFSRGDVNRLCSQESEDLDSPESEDQDESLLFDSSKNAGDGNLINLPKEYLCSINPIRSKPECAVHSGSAEDDHANLLSSPGDASLPDLQLHRQHQEEDPRDAGIKIVKKLEAELKVFVAMNEC